MCIAIQMSGSVSTFRGLVACALDVMTGFSTLPLELASLMGVRFSFIGLGD